MGWLTRLWRAAPGIGCPRKPAYNPHTTRVQPRAKPGQPMRAPGPLCPQHHGDTAGPRGAACGALRGRARWAAGGAERPGARKGRRCDPARSSSVLAPPLLGLGQAQGFVYAWHRQIEKSSGGEDALLWIGRPRSKLAKITDRPATQPLAISLLIKLRKKC